MVIQVTVNALLTSPTTYVAGGIGIAYVTKSNQPLPGQYNVSQTIARATNAPSSVQKPEAAEQGASVALAALSPEDELTGRHALNGLCGSWKMSSIPDVSSLPERKEQRS